MSLSARNGNARCGHSHQLSLFLWSYFFSIELIKVSILSSTLRLFELSSLMPSLKSTILVSILSIFSSTSPTVFSREVILLFKESFTFCSSMMICLPCCIRLKTTQENKGIANIPTNLAMLSTNSQVSFICYLS